MPPLRLKPRHALPLFSRHPWVYATALKRGADGSDRMAGMEVVVESDRGEPIARGLVNPASLIRVRLYSWQPERPLTADLFAERIAAAVALRQRLLGQTHTGRLLFSEADGLSGLTVDAYDGYLLVQLGSAALAARLETLLDQLEAAVQPRGIWLRVDDETARREAMDAADRLVRGEAPPRPLVIEQPAGRDRTVQFGVDLVGGQKTGFYFDQRENRIAAAEAAVELHRQLGRRVRVLDAHCYTGSFGCVIAKHAEVAGVDVSVLCVDSSAPALKMAARNAELNGVHRTLTTEGGDVGQLLATAAAEGRSWDLICLDPPKLARTRKAMNRAMKAYVRLNAAALAVLEPGGVLMTHSCSGLVDGVAFDQVLQRAALDAGVSLRVLQRRGAAVDHAPSVFCPETDYLKSRLVTVDRSLTMKESPDATSSGEPSSGEPSSREPSPREPSSGERSSDVAQPATVAAAAAAPNAVGETSQPSDPTSPAPSVIPAAVPPAPPRPPASDPPTDSSPADRSSPLPPSEGSSV